MRSAFVFIMIIFISCTTKPPKWYEKIYTDNQNFIYATGSGKTKQEAINYALANASSKISIVVKSIYKSKKYSYKGDDTYSYSNSTLLDIQTKTNPITFSEYKVLKLEKKDKYYVLIKINRYKNAKFMCENTNIDSFNESNLNLLFNYKKITNRLQKIIEKLKNINALYPLCKDKLNLAIKLKKKLQKKYSNLTFSIKSNDETIKNIIKSILKIKNSKNATIKIIAKTTNKQKQVGSYKINIITLNLTISDKNASKNFYFTCAGSSIQDYQTAKALAYQNCKEKIKEIFNN